MSSKQNSRFHKIHSLIRRNDWKQAYKESRFLAKNSNDPELRSIVVTSLWNWIQDQVRRNQREEAKANIKELLTFHDIPAEIRAEFVPVFLSLGLNSLLPEDSRQDVTSTEVQIEFVDSFILRGEPNPDILPDVLADAKRVRDAFQKIEAKRDDVAKELLAPISFRSPLAEWRLFLRGLVDHYQGNTEQAKESWKRLSPKRPPFRIAEKLCDVLDGTKTPTVSTGFFGWLFGSNNTDTSTKTAMLDSLRSMDDYLNNEKFKELIGRFQPFRSRFRDTEQIVVDRVLRIVHRHILRSAPASVVQQFVERNLPLPLDPKGRRSYAMLHERLVNEDETIPRWLESSSKYWRKFAEEDIDRIATFSDKMKNRAKAAVYSHLGETAFDDFLGLRDVFCDKASDGSDFAIDAIAKGVDEILEKAIAADPTYPNSWQIKLALYREKMPEKDRLMFIPDVAKICERMLESIPDDMGALQYLFNFHIDSDNGRAAKAYFDRVREIDPLSQSTAIMHHRLALNLSRNGLSRRDFTMAAEGFAINAEISLESMHYRFDVLPLALAYLNDILQMESGPAVDYFAVASEHGVEKRLPLVFAILVEAGECNLGKELIVSLELEFEKGIAGRCHGNTAGALADLAYNVLAQPKRFVHAKKLVEKVYDFVNRSGNVKWNSEKDLFGACNLLWQLVINEHDETYEKTFYALTKKGRKQFPNSPYFQFFEAEIEMTKKRTGIFRFTMRPAMLYEEFIKRFGNTKSDPELALFVNIAETKLSMLSDNPLGCFNPFDDDDDEYYDDDDDDFGSASSPILPDLEIPQEVRELVKELGGFPSNLRKELLRTATEKMGPLLGKLFVDATEECILKNLSPDNLDKILTRRLHSLTPNDLSQLMLSDFDDPEDDEDDDDSRDSRRKRARNSKKKKRR